MFDLNFMILCPQDDKEETAEATEPVAEKPLEEVATNGEDEEEPVTPVS